MARVVSSAGGLGMMSRIGNKKTNSPFTDYLGKDTIKKPVGKPEINTGYFSTDDIITV